VEYDAAMATASETCTPAATRSTDPALIYFTSGTTGGPKMVLHTHASYPLAHIATGKYWLDLQPTDLHWNLADTGWAKAAYSNLFGPWRMGAAVFIQHSPGRFDAQETLHLIAQHGITTFCAPPTAYRMMVLEDLARYNLTRLRHCVGAGEPLNPEVIAAWKAGTGRTIYDGYGQTETTLLVANYPCMEVKPGSMGKPVPGFDVAIIDAPNGTVLPPGQEGTSPSGSSPSALSACSRNTGKIQKKRRNRSRGTGTSPGTAVCKMKMAISGSWDGLTT